MSRTLECGFIPLVDCAPLVVARELGFAAEEGLNLVLRREPTWSAIRDKLAHGLLDVAHMLAPVPLAMSLGLGGLPLRLDTLQVLSVNGTVIGVSRALATRMRNAGGMIDFLDAEKVGRALIASAEQPLRIGVPFPFSMHAELLYYWLGALGLIAPRDLVVRTVPPPQMSDAIASGEIDAFCVGEPWGSIAVERGSAELVLPGVAIWQFAPEKVLAVRHDWAEKEAENTARLMRALWRAAKWASEQSNRMTLSEILGRPEYLDMSSEIIERPLAGRLVASPEGRQVRAPGFVEFFRGAATFPWRSQAVWIATRIARRMGLDPRDAATAARASYRSDLYRANLGAAGADLPGASEKLEGALAERSPVASSSGKLFLGPDRFFDWRTFDPMLYDGA